jgi:hypothetical protein
MEELFEELKHHRLEKVHFQVNRYEVILFDGPTISSGVWKDPLKVYVHSERHRIMMLVPTTLREVAVNE